MTTPLPDPAKLDAATVQTLRWCAYRTVYCQRCGVPAGQHCRSKGQRGMPGYQNSAVRHKPRENTVNALTVADLVQLAWHLLPDYHQREAAA